MSDRRAVSGRNSSRELPEGVRERRAELTHAAREGAMEGWLTVLRERHPELIWVAKAELDPVPPGS